MVDQSDRSHGPSDEETEGNDHMFESESEGVLSACSRRSRDLDVEESTHAGSRSGAYQGTEEPEVSDFWKVNRPYKRVRVHARSRRNLYVPQQSELPFPLSCLRNERRTVLVNQQNIRVVIDDNWRTAGEVNVGYGEWCGFTFFKLLGGPDEQQSGDGGPDDFNDYSPDGEDADTPDHRRTEATDHRAAEHRGSGSSKEEAYDAALSYVESVDKEFDNTVDGWQRLVDKGNKLVRSSGSVEKAAESLWHVREDRGLMNLSGIDQEEFEEVLHPDLLQYLRSIRKEGMPARYVGSQHRVKAERAPPECTTQCGPGLSPGRQGCEETQSVGCRRGAGGAEHYGIFAVRGCRQASP